MYCNLVKANITEEVFLSTASLISRYIKRLIYIITTYLIMYSVNLAEYVDTL